MIPFTTEDQKAFYAVVEPNFVNKLGYCFKMNYQPKKELPEQLMWVTSSKLLIQQDQTPKKRFIAERCIQRKGKKVISELDVAELYTTDSGIAFINSADQEKNFLKFGCYETLPIEAFAYVFDGKDMLGLKFVKTGDGANTYTLDSSSAGDKASKNFDIRKAVGAPIIKEVSSERIEVVGILNIEADGTLKPVIFDLQTFEQKSPRELESNDDKTDSPIQASKDTCDVLKVLKWNSPKGSSTQEDQTKSIGELAISKTSSSTLLPSSQCIKKKRLQNAPNIHTLIQNLKIFLDPKTLKGNDFRELAESFNYNNARINYLGSQTMESPTVALLQEESRCTIEELHQKLKKMKRDDAVEVIDEYIENQRCNCENCGGLC